MRLQVWMYASLLVACSYDLEGHPDTCGVQGDCATGQICYEGFCIDDDGRPDGSAGDCEEDGVRQSCYDGPAGTEGNGACRAGHRLCVHGALTECFDQVMPSPETCNGRDDDCNGEIDDVASQSCRAAIGALCTIEGTLVCRDGAPSCELAAAMEQESCNGNDDDCDGRTDEGASGVACYPQGQRGCVGDPSTGFTCLGLCAPGTPSCTGESSQCTGAVVPAAEMCTRDGASLDEDCDGKVDEGCSCDEASARPCYAGPAGAVGRGACREGTQTCSGGSWSACAGQVLPEPETCDNQDSDDDCNGTVDDVPGVGSPCTDDTKQGACTDGTLQCRAGMPQPVCVGSAPTKELCDLLDQDCDGNPVNGFDLNSRMTCGSCEVACSATQDCCGGQCIERETFETDVEHCGGCNSACGSNQYCCQGQCLNQPIGATAPASEAEDPAACNCASDCGERACCGTSCVDLVKDPHNCGACGYQCGREQECKGGACKARR